MASSTQRYTVVGTPLALLDLNINYFDRGEITVFFNDVISPVGTLWDWSGSSDKRILFTPSVAIGVTVIVKRTTDITKIRHAYTQGAAFTAATLDEDLTQVLHIAQEATESNLSTDFFNDVDMHSFRLHNIGTAVDPQDALTLGQYLLDAGGAAAAAAAATAAAADAVNAANAALAAVAGISYASSPEAIAGAITNKVMSPKTTHVAVRAVLSLVYPIGAIYISENSANPSTLFGFGTWVSHAVGRTLVSIDPSNTLMDTVGETFGQADTVLPTHNHGGSTGSTTLVGSFVSALDAVSGIVSVLYSFLGVGQDAQPNYVLKIDATHTHTIPSDGVSAINKNYQPSIAVYMWKRTA